MRPIAVVDFEYRPNGAIREIGLAFVADIQGTAMACYSPTINYFRLGEEPKLDLGHACDLIRTLDTEELMWASWGTNDRSALAQQCGDAGVGMPFGYFHVDIAPMFAVLMRFATPIKLKAAVETLDMEMLGSQHNAFDDAFNAARVLAELLNRFDRREPVAADLKTEKT